MTINKTFQAQKLDSPTCHAIALCDGGSSRGITKSNARHARLDLASSEFYQNNRIANAE